MNTRPELLVDSLEEGFTRVRTAPDDQQYIFIANSDLIDYHAELEPCDIGRVSPQDLYSIEYGVASPIGSPLKTQLNLAILHLKENGTLTQLRTKWWEHRSQCRNISERRSPIDRGWRFIQRQAGEFVILSCGVVVAFVLGIFEFCARKISERRRGTNVCDEEGCGLASSAVDKHIRGPSRHFDE